MRFKFSKKSFTRIYVNYAKIGSLSHIHYILACDGHFISTSFKDWDSSSYERVSHIYLKRWVQVTPGVTLQSYTFFKPLDLSRSNGQKNTPINANILIKISLIISHLLYFISISKPKKKRLHLNLYIFLYLFLLHHCSTSMRDSGSTQKLNSFSFHHPIIPLSLSTLF